MYHWFISAQKQGVLDVASIITMAVSRLKILIAMNRIGVLS